MIGDEGGRGEDHPMSKRIDAALQEFVAALEEHAAVLAEKPIKRGKSQRATSEVRRAAANYAAVVFAHRKIDSPFLNMPDPRLDRITTASLEAERDRLKKKRRKTTTETDEGATTPAS
jgi:hypothetical protein